MKNRKRGETSSLFERDDGVQSEAPEQFLSPLGESFNSMEVMDQEWFPNN